MLFCFPAIISLLLDVTLTVLLTTHFRIIALLIIITVNSTCEFGRPHDVVR